jgi:phosphoribosylaminoimidazole carboxylase
LPGMVASETALPVVGVPVKGSVLDGVDSLYSIVQMPVSRRGHAEYTQRSPY